MSNHGESFFSIWIANIFPVMRQKHQRLLIVSSVIVHYMLWEINAAVIFPIPIKELKTA
jgi:hypothetical protein